MRHEMRCRFLPLLLLVLLVTALAPASVSAGKHQSPGKHQSRLGACASSHAVIERGEVHRARVATLCLLNRIRTRAGLRKLQLSRKLSRAAGRHSREMVRRGYFGHNSANGRTPFDRMRGTHYVPRNSSWWLGENIGWGGGSAGAPAALVRMWMHSPPHRANILSRRYREIGIGIALGIPVRGAHLSGNGPAGATYTTDFGFHS